MYKHEDIDRHHIHIVTVNVNEEGKRLNQDFLYRRSKKITTELEEKYNLHKAQREKVSPDTPITKLDPSGDVKRQVANTVKLVGMRWKFQTLGEYNAILGLYNIRCEETDGRVTAVSIMDWYILRSMIMANRLPIRSRLQDWVSLRAGLRLKDASREARRRLTFILSNVRSRLRERSHETLMISLPNLKNRESTLS